MEGRNTMAYRATNAARAYDMWAPDRAAAAPAPVAPRPHLDVVTGAGREASQATSPAFVHCIKVFCVLAIIVCALGAARVAIAGVTAASLNGAASLSNELESAQDESSDLEVMRSVYGATTRIRDLAEGYGMVAAEGGVTLDFTEHAANGSTASSASADASSSTQAAQQ